MGTNVGPTSDVDGRLKGHAYMYEARRTVLDALEVLATLALVVGYWGINCANLYEAQQAASCGCKSITWQLLG